MPAPSDHSHDLLTWQGFVARLARLRDAAANLSRPATFDVTIADATHPDVATVAVHGRPTPAEYSLSVLQLSQAHKLITGTFKAGACELGLSGAVAVNGCRVSINPADSLSDIAVKFTRSAANVRAQTVHLGPDDFRLILTANQTGIDGAITLSSITGDALEMLALTVPSAHLVAPKDARFTIDGIEHSAPQNTVIDAIPGATITLLSGPVKGSPAACKVTIGVDPSTAVETVAEFVDALSAASSVDWVKNDRTAEVIASISESIVGGAGCVDMLDAGLSLQSDGHLILDRDALRVRLEADSEQVYRVFAVCVDSDCPELAFVSASAKTLESPASGYIISIVTPASVSTVTAEVAQTEASTETEHLTFSGPLFPTPVKITLPIGGSANDVRARINRSPRLRGRVSADIDSAGKLTLVSRFGVAGVFMATSDLAACSNTSGIGLTPTVVEGVDVDGTIGGEPAEGEGRTLTGCAGNAHTEALQILVTTTIAGDCGRITLHRGLADRVFHVVHQVLEPGQSAAIRSGDVSAQIDDTEQQIVRMNDQLGAFGEYLQQTLSAMDIRVNHLRQQADTMARRTTRSRASRTF